MMYTYVWGVLRYLYMYRAMQKEAFVIQVNIDIIIIIFLCSQFYLSAIPDHLTPAIKSAASLYVRPVSQGQQVFTPDTSQFPVGQPVTKLTAKLQVNKGYFSVYRLADTLLHLWTSLWE